MPRIGITPNLLRTPVMDQSGNLTREWSFVVGRIIDEVSNSLDSGVLQAFDPEAAREDSPLEQVGETTRRSEAEYEPGGGYGGQAAADLDEVRALQAVAPALQRPEETAPDVTSQRSWQDRIEETLSRVAVAAESQSWQAVIGDIFTLLAAIQEPNGRVERHAPTHQDGGTDEVGVSAPAAYAIPKANSAGYLDGWLQYPVFISARSTYGEETGTGGVYTWNAYYDGGWKYRANGVAALLQIDSGILKLYKAVAGLAGGAVAFNQLSAADLGAAAPFTGLSVTRNFMTSFTPATVTLQYKDWANANASAVVVVGIGSAFPNNVFSNGVLTA